MSQLLSTILNKKNSLKGATGILVVTLLLSNILGVIRDHFLAQKIPAGFLDIYYTAFRWPDLLFNVIVLGAVSAAFIPVFVSSYDKDKATAMAIANGLMVYLTGILLLLTITIFWAMPGLIKLIAPGFGLDKLETTTRAARLLLISPFFFGLSYIFSSVLQTWQRFFTPALSPLVYNLAIIIATLVGADHFGVFGVIWGVIIGSLLHAIIQIPTLLAGGWRFSRLILANQHFKKIFYLALPRVFGLIVNQFILISFTSFASVIGAGTIAIYHLADNIQTTPTVIIGNSISSALFPRLSMVHAQQDEVVFSSYITRSVSVILFVMVPIAFGMILLRSQIVRLILGSGYFGWPETIQAANTLAGFALGLPWASLIPLLSKAFYARHNTLLPTTVNIFGSIFTILLGYWLSLSLGIFGLSLAFSLGSLTIASLLYFNLKKYLLAQDSRHGKVLANIVIGSLIMALFVQLTKRLMGTLWPLNTGWAVLGQLLAATLIGASVYYVYMRLTRSPVLQQLIKTFQ